MQMNDAHFKHHLRHCNILTSTGNMFLSFFFWILIVTFTCMTRQKLQNCTNSADLHGLTSDFQVNFSYFGNLHMYMKNWLFLLCNVYLDNYHDLHTFTNFL